MRDHEPWDVALITMGSRHRADDAGLPRVRPGDDPLQGHPRSFRSRGSENAKTLDGRIGDAATHRKEPGSSAGDAGIARYDAGPPTFEGGLGSYGAHLGNYQVREPS
jgi:hypothetical protein